MEIRTNSRLIQRRIDPRLYEFRDYLGQEIVVGLKGKDQFGNDRIGYITGIVGLEKEQGLGVGLYEIVDGKTGVGVANRIIQLNMETPIAEAFFPMTITEQRDASRDLKTDLTYKVRTDPRNPNSSAIDTYTFKSK